MSATLTDGQATGGLDARDGVLCYCASRRRCGGSYHDIEGSDHVEGGGKYGTHGLHRWLVQAVIGRQDLAV